MVGREAVMTDVIEDIIGDYRAFAAQQRDRLLARDIDVAPYTLGHVAVRVPERLVTATGPDPLPR